MKKGERLFDEQAMAAWAAAQGVDRARSEAVFDSFSVQGQVSRTDKLTELYRVNETLVFVIGGRFMTSSSTAGNSCEGGGAVKLTEDLIALVRG